MTHSYVQHTEALGAADLEAINGGEVPAGWWLFTYLVSESQSFIDGLQAGFNAAS